MELLLRENEANMLEPLTHYQSPHPPYLLLLLLLFVPTQRTKSRTEGIAMGESIKLFFYVGSVLRERRFCQP